MTESVGDLDFTAGPFVMRHEPVQDLINFLSNFYLDTDIVAEAMEGDHQGADEVDQQHQRGSSDPQQCQSGPAGTTPTAATFGQKTATLE